MFMDNVSIFDCPQKIKKKKLSKFSVFFPDLGGKSAPKIIFKCWTVT